MEKGRFDYATESKRPHFVFNLSATEVPTDDSIALYKALLY